MTFQLEEHIVRLREELDREREEKSYFQLERDKIRAFWEICKRHLEEARAELRNREREGEEAEEQHRVEITVRASHPGEAPEGCELCLSSRDHLPSTTGLQAEAEARPVGAAERHHRVADGCRHGPVVGSEPERQHGTAAAE